MQYSINNGSNFQASGTFTNLIQGNYSVLVSDVNGCTATANSSISNTPGPVIATIPVTNSLCYNSDNGTATVQITGGTGPFQYSINGSSNTQMINYFGNLSTGNYSISVIDANGCLADSSFTITEPAAITTSVALTNSTCSNSNGTLIVNGNGGTGALTFSANGGLTYQPTNIFSNMAAGIYSIMVQDSNGCMIADSALILDAPAPIVHSLTGIGASCNGLSNGILTLSTNGGTLPLQFSINNGVSFQTSNIFNNLAQGVYDVMVTDANGCSAAATGTILEPAQILLNTSSTATLCNGSGDGTASVSVLGGVTPYSYNWTGGTTGVTASNLVAGTYIVTVTDANGCSTALAATVLEPLPITIQQQLTNISCNGLSDGSLILTPGGGTAPYSYSWLQSGLSGHDNSNLSAGNYTVVVSDANGCSYSQTYLIFEPSALVSTTSAIPTLCFGSSDGNATVNVSGGTAPYSYLWSNNATTPVIGSLLSGTYTVTVTDANGCSNSLSETIVSPTLLAATIASTPVTCNGDADGTAQVSVTGGTTPYSYLWTNGGTNSLLPNIDGGNFSVTITDANNCSLAASVVVQEPLPLVVFVNGSETICIGQSTLISATAQGGNGGYQYLWNNGISGSSQFVNPILTAAFSVTVTDSLGCQATGAPVVVVVNPALSLITSPDDSICEGEQTLISAIASGGNGGPYTYSWSGISNTSSQVNVSPILTTTYIVTVSDGCGTPSALANVEVVVNPLPVVDFVALPFEGCAPLEVVFDNNTITSANGALYQWYFGDNTSSNDFEPVHIYYEPGNYTVTLKVISAEGCAAELIINDAVKVYPVPVAGIGTTPSVANILNPTISFFDTGSGATWWNWDFGDNSSLSSTQNTEHTFEETGIYNVTLYIMNDFGCRDTAYTEIVINQSSTVYIPNAFTPNGDGINEIFNVSGIGIDGIQMSIFNRWGNMVFSARTGQDGWNGNDMYSGTKCQTGVYVYQIKVKTFNGEYKNYTGRVTLLE
ncbi:MAG: gliding motility-associated C-terminal domain-containing protein [Bacteroidetes bacterium]|nr:gliding motility-associated C-terminal domain-containing protein [Bacteroidota bacterium]